jgi:hypothetical protein
MDTCTHTHENREQQQRPQLPDLADQLHDHGPLGESPIATAFAVAMLASAVLLLALMAYAFLR